MKVHLSLSRKSDLSKWVCLAGYRALALARAAAADVVAPQPHRPRRGRAGGHSGAVRAIWMQVRQVVFDLTAAFELSGRC